MNQNNWCICCPGPSLSLYKTRKKILLSKFDVTVAVNGAILFDSIHPFSRIIFDYWAAVDVDAFDSVFKQTREGIGLGLPTLWIPDYWERHINKGFQHLKNFYNTFKKETYPANEPLALETIVKFGPEINWNETTLFSAIALAVKHEAKTVHIFGADMKGKGYHKPGLENTRTRHNEQRWMSERSSFDQIIHICKQRGITIIREI